VAKSPDAGFGGTINAPAVFTSKPARRQGHGPRRSVDLVRRRRASRPPIARLAAGSRGYSILGCWRLRGDVFVWFPGLPAGNALKHGAGEFCLRATSPVLRHGLATPTPSRGTGRGAEMGILIPRESLGRRKRSTRGADQTAPSLSVRPGHGVFASAERRFSGTGIEGCWAQGGGYPSIRHRRRRHAAARTRGTPARRPRYFVLPLPATSPSALGGRPSVWLDPRNFCAMRKLELSSAQAALEQWRNGALPLLGASTPLWRGVIARPDTVKPDSGNCDPPPAQMGRELGYSRQPPPRSHQEANSRDRKRYVEVRQRAGRRQSAVCKSRGRRISYGRGTDHDAPRWRKPISYRHRDRANVAIEASDITLMPRGVGRCLDGSVSVAKDMRVIRQICSGLRLQSLAFPSPRSALSFTVGCCRRCCIRAARRFHVSGVERPSEGKQSKVKWANGKWKVIQGAPGNFCLCRFGLAFTFTYMPQRNSSALPTGIHVSFPTRPAHISACSATILYPLAARFADSSAPRLILFTICIPPLSMAVSIAARRPLRFPLRFP